MIKAIDVVIVPPIEIRELCYNLNKKAKELGVSLFELGETDFVPHISLLLGCVDDSNILKIKELLGKLVLDNFQFNLEINGIGVYISSNGDKKLHYQVNLTDQLLELHKKCVLMIEPYLVKCENESVLVEGEKTGIRSSSLNILNNFVSDFSFDKYHPHITLGSFDFESKNFVFKGMKLPIKFKVSNLAMYQVGNGCTCRIEMYSGDLKK